MTDATVAAGPLCEFEDLLTEALPFDPQKRRFEPQTVFPGGFVEACDPRAIFFPIVTGERTSRTRTLSQAQTMARLIRMCPWACYDRPAAKAHLDGKHWQAVESYVRDHSAAEFSHGLCPDCAQRDWGGAVPTP